MSQERLDRKWETTLNMIFAVLKQHYWKTKNTELFVGQHLQPNYTINKMFTEAWEKRLNNISITVHYSFMDWHQKHADT